MSYYGTIQGESVFGLPTWTNFHGGQTMQQHAAAMAFNNVSGLKVKLAAKKRAETEKVAAEAAAKAAAAEAARKKAEAERAAAEAAAIEAEKQRRLQVAAQLEELQQQALINASTIRTNANAAAQNHTAFLNQAAALNKRADDLAAAGQSRAVVVQALQDSQQAMQTANTERDKAIALNQQANVENAKAVQVETEKRKAIESAQSLLSSQVVAQENVIRKGLEASAAVSTLNHQLGRVQEKQSELDVVVGQVQHELDSRNRAADSTALSTVQSVVDVVGGGVEAPINKGVGESVPGIPASVAAIADPSKIANQEAAVLLGDVSIEQPGYQSLAAMGFRNARADDRPSGHEGFIGSRRQRLPFML